MNFLKKLFSPICLIISLLLLVYIFYKAEIYWAGTRDQYYLYYYVFSFILIISSIFTFFISYKVTQLGPWAHGTGLCPTIIICSRQWIIKFN